MAGDGAQQLVIFNGRRYATVGETENADQFSRGASQTNQGAIGPSETGCESRSYDFSRRCERHVVRVFRECGTERPNESQQNGFIADLIIARHQDSVEIHSLEKAECDRPSTEQFGGAASKVPHELRQMQDGVKLQRDRYQGFGAAAMFLRLMQVTGQFESDCNLRG